MKVSEARSGREPTEVIVGTVGRAHGIKGEVAIDLRTDEPDRRFVVGAILGIEGTETTVRVVSTRWHGGRLLVHFAEFADRTAAEQARGARLVTEVDPAERPADPEEYYDRQLVGLSVLDAAGTPIGPVTAVLHLPEQDLLEIDLAGERRLVPFVAALVSDVDLAAGTVRLVDVPGLLRDVDEA